MGCLALSTITETIVLLCDKRKRSRRAGKEGEGEKQALDASVSRAVIDGHVRTVQRRKFADIIEYVVCYL